MRVIAIIPARGGSKGIPKKNIRLMAGKPLIAYSIINALKCRYIDDVYVSTDSDEIAEVAGHYGANVIRRSDDLATDLVTLDPVIYDAVTRIEAEKKVIYDYVITMQPTSPLLKLSSLEGAVKKCIDDDRDCLISVINRPHLSWRDGESGVVPNYEKRLNRQQLPANYLETGAFVISRRSVVTETSRMSGNIGVYEISQEEGIDIDDKNDWVLSETLLGRKRIIFRVEGHKQLGLGHVYNCITLAYAMMEHDILIVTSDKSDAGIKKLKEANLPLMVIHEDDEIDRIIDEFKPDIWVNDVLNTEASYIRHLKEKIDRVITIEDLGSGTAYADAVINALYTDDDIKGDNIYNGWKYVCLRDEFQIEPINEFRSDVRNVMIMFGGTDPCNFTGLLYDIILDISDKYPDINFNFVTGIGYDYEAYGLKTVEDKRIYIYPNVSRVTKYMKGADIAIISQGRTVFECAAMGIPSIVLSQNEREAMHSFANMRNGFLNLGVGETVDKEIIANTLAWLINTAAIRENMHKLMSRYPFRSGISRVKEIILDQVID